MKKYLFIYKTTMIESLQYVINILLSFITFFMMLFVFLCLWRYLYSDPSNTINGYTMQQMIWYVIFTEILWFGSRNRTLTLQITTDIKSGTIAYGINKPYHYILYIIAKHLGEITLKMFLFIGAGLLIGFSFVGAIPNFQLLQLPFVLISTILGIMINAFIRINISVLSFWIEDALPFQWIYDKLIIVIGMLFPVEMFPAWAQPVIRWSPIYVVTYGPAKLLIDYNSDVFLRVLSVQMIYFIVTLCLLLFMFQKGVKKLNVNGG
ncbi:MAG TPA: ABC transporter permease [Mobilitalea sp.]|nr:ABC transporter permease [Mobilitalea sp.]